MSESVGVSRELVLFEGPLGTQRVKVWLEPRGTGIGLLSHDIGPAVERAFGSDDIETFLEIGAAQLPALAGALGAGSSAAAVMDALAQRYRGDSAATSHLRVWLEELGITYQFTLA